MQISITKLPGDIIKNVTRENWEELFDEYMVHKLPSDLAPEQYTWKTDVMRDFIKALLK